jgi:hypothetical protein
MLRLAAWFTLLVVLAASLGVYLTMTGTSRPLVDLCARTVGSLLVGQRTEAVRTEIDIRPDEHWLAARTALRVRSATAGRQHLFFLLNPGLHLQGVRWNAQSATVPAPRVYRLWALTVVDLGHPLAKDEAAEFSLEYQGKPLLDGFPVDGAAALEPGSVLLTPDIWWYPADLQGWFEAEVDVTLPAGFTVVHSGVDGATWARGDLQRVRWQSERAVNGMSVVAGPYTLTRSERGGLRLQLFLPTDVSLDPTRMLDALGAGNKALTDRYGPPGFRTVSAFVSRNLMHAFNDGAGVIGLPLRAARSGDYGARALGCQLARNWWGATVGDRPLAPRAGGTWIMEGMAAYSGLLAAGLQPGSDGWTRALARGIPDPTRTTVLTDVSAVDARLAAGNGGEVVCRQATYVLAMLADVLGDETFTDGLRRFLEQHRLQQVGDADLQLALEQASGKPLQAFFDSWTGSAQIPDLYLEGGTAGEVAVRARGNASSGPALEVSGFTSTDTAPTRATTHVGDTLSGPGPDGFMVLDPRLLWPDGYREDNRFPRRQSPLAVAPAATGPTAVVSGDVFPWAPSRITLVKNDGASERAWDFPHGIHGVPTWSADGSQLVVLSEQPGSNARSVEVLDRNGGRRSLGAGTGAAPGTARSVYIARADRLLLIGADGHTAIVVQRPGQTLDDPQPSPDGTMVAYTAARGAHLELRLVTADGQNDRLVLGWDRDRFAYRWAPDGTRLFAIVPGTWDWQIWAIPLTGNVDVLASGAPMIADLALSPDGARLAFIAASSLDAPTHAQIFVMHLAERSVSTVALEHADPIQLAWTDADRLLLVAESRPPSWPWTLPAERSVKRIRLSDGTVGDWP